MSACGTAMMTHHTDTTGVVVMYVLPLSRRRLYPSIPTAARGDNRCFRCDDICPSGVFALKCEWQMHFVDLLHVQMPTPRFEATQWTGRCSEERSGGRPGYGLRAVGERRAGPAFVTRFMDAFAPRLNRNAAPARRHKPPRCRRVCRRS